MEKKNTILLTVIAIATLLVAVVGATFAYFTATITTTNDANNTVTAKTYALTAVQMDYGNEVKSEGMFPGTTVAKEISITANCPEGSTTCEPVNTTITITSTDEDSVFGNDIKWTLYKMNAKTDSITCNSENHTEGGNYYATSECSGLDDGTAVGTGTGAGVKTIDVKAYGSAQGENAKTDDKYYLVVEYLNHTDEDGNTSEQNNQQGHSFSVTLNFAAKA